MEKLPNELLLGILFHLEEGDLFHCALVSKHWHLITFRLLYGAPNLFPSFHSFRLKTEKLTKNLDYSDPSALYRHRNEVFTHTLSSSRALFPRSIQRGRKRAKAKCRCEYCLHKEKLMEWHTFCQQRWYLFLRTVSGSEDSIPCDIKVSDSYQQVFGSSSPPPPWSTIMKYHKGLLSLTCCFMKSGLESPLEGPSSLRSFHLMIGSMIRKLDLSQGASHVEDLTLCRVLDGCPAIDHLNVKGCHRLTDIFAVHLSFTHRTLSYLNLSRCHLLSKEGLRCVLSRQQNLGTLDITNLPSSIDDEVLEVLFYQRMKLSMRHLTARECPLLGEKGMQWIELGGAKLVWLDLFDCIRIGDNEILQIASHCPQLRRLNTSRKELPKRPSVETHAIPTDIVERNGEPTLGPFETLMDNSESESAEEEEEESIDPYEHCHITDKSILPLLHSCQYLEQLHLNFTEITDQVLIYLSNHTKYLQSLGVAGCPLITSSGISTLDDCPSLTWVNMHGCPQVDVEWVCQRKNWKLVRMTEMEDKKLRWSGWKGSWEYVASS